MKRLLSLGILLSALGIGLGPSPSQAFNSAAHVYIADQVAHQVFPFTFDRTDLYYGSIAPDIPMYGNWPNGFCETHYEFTKLSFPWWNLIQKAFSQGWQIHNEMWPWGADYWAHGTCSDCKMDVCGYGGYVPTQAEKMISGGLLPDNPQGHALAHFAVEVAIDLLLVDRNDHFLGEKLLGAALFRSPEDLNLLKAVFVGHPGFGTDFPTLSSAEATFRNLVINYATALTLPEHLRAGVLGQLGVQIAQGMGVDIDSAKVHALLQAAIELCGQSYYGPIQESIKGIISNKSKVIR